MKKYIIGIDLGGTNLRIGLFDREINLKDKKVFSTRQFNNKITLINNIVRSTEDIIKDNYLKKDCILGIGLGVPGPVDYKKQIIHFLPNIKGWFNVPLGKILKESLGINNIFIDNDANLVCLAESKMGSAKGYKNVVCITLGTGVGGGLFIENKLYRGSNYAAGEIGHIPLYQNGPICSCGAKGCLESYVGNLKIMKEAKKVFKRDINLEELSKLAKLKNRKATKIWKNVGEKIGTVLTGVVNLLNPAVIVIAGGISNAGEILFKNIRKTIINRAMFIQSKQVKILGSHFKDNAGIIGAALLVKMEVGRC
ncbi:MAG: ROK family protein [Candidatus Omnitrophica bacterium]|nr:ROK family protein [Candidatus Omnitrophota bacterium]